MSEATTGTKPESFFVVITSLNMRVQYLQKICRLLITQAEPERRRELERIVDDAMKHGMDFSADA